MRLVTRRVLNDADRSPLWTHSDRISEQKNQIFKGIHLQKNIYRVQPSEAHSLRNFLGLGWSARVVHCCFWVGHTVGA